MTLRRLLVSCASAGVGFLLLTALGHASVPQLLWCAVPLAATVHLAVAVARTDPNAQPSPGAGRGSGFGPVTVPLMAAISTALNCVLGSALALLFFLHLRGELSGLPFDGAAAALLGAGAPIPLPGAMTLLASVPAVAAAASAISLRPRRALPGTEADRPQEPTPSLRPGPLDMPAPSDLPWGTALVATGLALGAYAGEAAQGATKLRLTLPGGMGYVAPAVVVGWGVIALGLVLAGPGIAHVCGKLLCAVRPGALRLLSGRVLQEEARRIGRPLGALCAVSAGAMVALALREPAAGAARELGPIASLGAALVVACTLLTVLSAALEIRHARAHTTAALLRLGAGVRLLRGAAAIRTLALLLAFGPLAVLIAELAALPLR